MAAILAATEMRPIGRRSVRLAHPLASAALAAVIAATASGCQTTQTSETTGSVAAAPVTSTPPVERSDADWRHDVELLGQKYRADPTKIDVALRYAQALRATGQRAQAVAVLERASIENPHDKTVLGAYGRALAEAGNYNQALEVLERAHTPDQPDWRILSAQGAVLDQMGRHGDAQRHYLTALKIVPDEPSVLSNLGLSFALSKDLRNAETTLRRAAAHPPVDPRVRQNLALVVGLQGRFTEAETIARADLPPEQAAANVAYLRQMLAQRKAARPPIRPGGTGDQDAAAAQYSSGFPLARD
jgi:Flp pilus assembly protein TadD